MRKSNKEAIIMLIIGIICMLLIAVAIYYRIFLPMLEQYKSGIQY